MPLPDHHRSRGCTYVDTLRELSNCKSTCALPLSLYTFREQSRYNPRFCAKCSQFVHSGGAEVILTMLFADVRGSTALAEKVSPIDFSRLINRFYVMATDVLVRTDALVD